MNIIRICLLCFLLVACSDDKQTSTSSTTKQATINASGKLISSDNAIIGPPQAKGVWQYKIIFMAPEGKVIQQGQPLIGFDASSLRQLLRSKNNELNRAAKKLETSQLQQDEKAEDLKLKLAEAQMNLEKSERKWLQSKGLDSQIDTKRLALEHQLAKDNVVKFKRTIVKSNETRLVQLARIESNVSRLTLEVKQYADSIKKMMVKSPKSGIVVYKSSRNGEKSAVGDSVWMGRQLIELPSLDAMMIKAEILEADAGKIAVGQEVDIILDAASDRVFKGKVAKLGTVFRRKSVEQPNIIFDADISINQLNHEIMRPGMAARVKINVQASLTGHNDE